MTVPDAGTVVPDPGRRAALDAERRRTLARVAALERDHDAIVRAVAADPPDDEHDPEGATTAFERQQLAALIDAARAHLAELDAVAGRLAAGTAGCCETCGGPIGEARLAARPASVRCIGCAAAARA